MSRKSVSRISKTPKPNPANLPSLSKQRMHAGTPTNLNSDLNIYSYISDNSYNLNTVRKFFTPTHEPKSSILPFRSNLEGQLDSFSKQKTEKLPWEVSERIESCEIRIGFSPNFISPTEEFHMWGQCISEILPMIKGFNQEIGSSVQFVTNKLVAIFKESCKTYEESEKKTQKANSDLLKKVKILEAELDKSKKILNKKQDTKRLNLAQIAKEITEIFGENTNEIELFQLKSKQLLGIENSGTAEYLKDLYNSMNKEFEIPDSKTNDLPAMNLEDFSQTIDKKFRILQKSTANRVYKLLETIKPKRAALTQTVENYVSPSDFESVKVALEKTTIQSQSLNMQLEKLKEDYKEKNFALEILESQKISGVNELAKCKRELENCSKENANWKKENEIFRIELSILKSGGENARKSTGGLENIVNEQTAKISALGKVVERNEAVIKEKDEKIKNLEEKIEMRRVSKFEKSEPEKNITYPGALKSEKKYETNYENDRFDEMMKSIPKKTKMKATTINPISMNSDSKVSLSENNGSLTPIPQLSQEKTILKPQYSQEKAVPKAQDFSTVSRNASSLTQDSYQKTLPESNLPTRGTSRDTPIIRDTPLARVDETKELKKSKETVEEKNLKQLQIPKEKNRVIQKKNSSDITDSLPNEFENLEIRKKGKKRYEESEEEYQINKGIQWDLMKSHPSTQGIEFESSEIKNFIGKDGVEYSVVDKGVWTTDELKYILVAECSKSTQASERLLESVESKNSFGKNVYFLPYNPNNTYGLKGDNYFHSKNAVFQAQPKIPDLTSSILFKSPYVMDKDRENKYELPGFLNG